MTSIMRFDSLESTNKHCKLLDLDQVEEFSVVWAMRQTGGIGQRGNAWESEPFKNLTISIILHPYFLNASRQFALTQTLSLGVCDFLGETLPNADCNIKWPNDIYVGQKKICGMLTESHVSCGRITSSVCGIGLNVNQISFPEWVPNPTSMQLESGKEYELEPLLLRLLALVAQRYEQLRLNQQATINEAYRQKLLFRGMRRRFIYQGHEITATIEDVDNYGRLILCDIDNQRLLCDIKEIQFVV